MIQGFDGDVLELFPWSIYPCQVEFSLSFGHLGTGKPMNFVSTTAELVISSKGLIFDTSRKAESCGSSASMSLLLRPAKRSFISPQTESKQLKYNLCNSVSLCNHLLYNNKDVKSWVNCVSSFCSWLSTLAVLQECH